MVLALALTLTSDIALATVQTPGQITTSPDTGALESLMFLGKMSGINLNRARVQQAVRQASPQQSSALSTEQLIVAAADLSLPLQRKHLTLQEIRQRGGITILHLQATNRSKRFVTLAAIGSQYAVIFDRGHEQVISCAALQRQFSGETLVVTMAQDNGAWLHVDEPVHVIQATSEALIIQKIAIRNQGPQTLRLEIDSISCGCTQAELSTKTLAPGQAGTLNIEIEPPSWGTAKTINIILHSNAPFFPRSMLAFTTTMMTTAKVVPSQLLIHSTAGLAAVRSLKLLLPKTASIVNISSAHPFITAQAVASEPQGNGIEHRILVSVTSKAPTGPFNDKLRFELKDAGVASIEVPVNGEIEPDVEITPRLIFLDRVSNGTPLRKAITIQSHSGHTFNIKSIECANPHITAKVDSPAMAPKHEVAVEFTVTKEPGSVIQDAVKITLSNGRILNLPVVGMIARSDKTSAPPNK